MPVIRAAISIRKLIMEKLSRPSCSSVRTKIPAAPQQMPEMNGSSQVYFVSFSKFLIHKFHNITILYKHHDNKYNIKTDIAMRTCPFLIYFGILLIIIIFQNYHVNEYILLQIGQKS